MIETEGLTRKFGELTAVEDLTLNVKKGEVFGFLGPNAAGKTTTIRLLCCLIEKTRGKARIGNFDVDNKDDRIKIRKMVGLLPESVGLYDSLSAYRNLDFYGRLYEVSAEKRKENIQSLLQLLDIWGRRNDLVGTFSKGMKQKIAIARSLIHDPELLFLDEPTANLDPEASKTVRDFILNLKKQKRTIFINTHNLDEAERLCDRIGIINTQLVTVGSPESLAKGLHARKTVLQLESVNRNVLAAVEKLPMIKNVQTLDNKLVLEMDEPEMDNPELIRAVVAAGGKIQFVTELRSTLEDVYLKLIKESKSR
ncbi:MAG: ABC transporter ATP-binding protein [Candidatus Bathyarchaeota archaeon]|nr:ABC transporter ATP-binding protein [Candidatus Bathyarchaeum tardum]